MRVHEALHRLGPRASRDGSWGRLVLTRGGSRREARHLAWGGSACGVRSDQGTSVGRTLASLLLAVGLILIGVGPAAADTLLSTEIRVTASPAYETTPTLGADGTSEIVVYTSRDLDSGSQNGQIFFQRISQNGPIGPPVLVSEGGFDDQLNDISGDFIVYTSYVSAVSDTGVIKLYQISSGFTDVLSELTTVFEARIHGNLVAWVEGSPGSTRVMLFNLAGVTRRPVPIAGPFPPASDVEIGNTLVVWRERSNLQDDVFAYDLRTGTRVNVSSDPAVNERAPATAGPWIVWDVSGGSVVGVQVHALNVDTGERRVVAANGALNQRPTIDGDIISYESNVSGTFEIYLYRISTGETFQATTHPSDQLVNNVFGNMVAYVDDRDGNSDVFVTVFRFVPNGEIDVSPFPAYQFGDVEVGATRNAIVTISNLSPQHVLTVSDVSFAAGGSADFAISAAPLLPVQIPANGSVLVDLAFTPSAPGNSSAVLQIVSDDPDEGLVQLTLDGTGVLAEPPPAEQIRNILDFIEEALNDGTLAGSGPGGSAKNRAEALKDMIQAAGDLVRQGLIAEACQQLQDVLKKTDGFPKPPDFVTGSAATDLAARIQALLASLGCP